MADADASDATPDHAGHGARRRGRLLDGNVDGMADHELVEYLPALAVPRRDAKLLANSVRWRN